MIPRPQKGFRWLLKQANTYDLVVTVFASTVGFSSAYNYYSQTRIRLASVVGLATVGMLVFTCVKHVVTLAAARKKDSVHELEGCLYTLLALLDGAALQTPGRVRLAIHVPDGDGLVQVTEYIGATPKKGRIGRSFPANAGIIGKAFREHETFVGKRVNDDYELYVQELVRDWNYTEEQARRLNPGTRAWMAVPLFDRDRNRVEAVLYIDSTATGFFTSERQELALSAVTGVAIFIGRRYS